MAADIYAIWDNFKNFIGGRNGLLHWGLFCLAAVLILLRGRKKEKQTDAMAVKVFVWPSVLILCILFQPFFYRYVGSRFFAGVYWRLFWMLPVSFVVAYACVQIICRFQKQTVRLLVLAAVLAIIAKSGQQIYSRETFVKAENEYKLPQAAIDVADIIGNAGVNWKVKSVVPNELLCYIRQYRCDIGLLYGRNIGGFISGIGDDEAAVYQQMCQAEPDMELLTEITRRHEVIFLCFNRTMHKLPENMKQYGYHYYSETGDYIIYILGEE